MTTDNVGGVWTYALELAKALGQESVDIILAAMGTPLSSKQWQEASSIPRLTVCESQFKLEWMDDPWPDLEQAGHWLLAVQQEHHPDLIHLNGYVHGALPWHAPVLVVGHSCVLSWWQAVKHEPAPPSWNRYRDAVAQGLRAADHVAAPTRTMLQCLKHFYGPLNSTSVIPNGRDAMQFTPQKKEPFIFSAGRLWDEAKNISALNRVARSLPWPVYVAGDPQHPSGTRAQVHPEVRCLGKLAMSQTTDWFGRAAIYALPARYEPFGLSALEAGLSGCALVLGDIPSLREVWGDAAVYVPPEDPAALRQALIELIEDDFSRRTYADRALLRAQTFTPNRMAAGYLELYHTLIEQKQPVHAYAS